MTPTCTESICGYCGWCNDESEPEPEDDGSGPTLVRWRADPEKVRVAVRRVQIGWMCAVTAPNAKGYDTIYAVEITPPGLAPWDAVDRALNNARTRGCPGLDLDMQWTYEHPWK